ncbi:hypothetical protein ANN_00669 [Periplaneta americana]|uniref:Uncharacterized protein n=1 Tax=Periplaneta americana TaxID=6978 RepID=A0ABQ8TT52_PERAM|nr:hypothetical protein ANN_00669 [Periplaneta americana]
MDLREVGNDGRDWINVAQDRDQQRAYTMALQYGKKNPATFSEEQSKERGATQPYRHERRPKHRKKAEVEMGRAHDKDGPQTMDAQTDIVGSQDRQKKSGTPDN